MSYKSHRIPPQIIARAVWLYFRFPLGLRLVEEKLFERRIVLSYEIRRSATKFGLDCSRRLARLDALLRGGQDLAEPIFGTCLRRRLALEAGAPARRWRGYARTRAPCATPSIFGGEMSPAGRVHACSGVTRGCWPASTRRCARRSFSGSESRSTPAGSPSLPRRPTRSWPQRGPAPPP